MRKRKGKVLAALLLAVLVVAGGLGITVSALNGAEPGTICDGVYVDGIALGGMTEADAESTLEEYVDQLKDTRVILTVDEDHVEETTLKILGLEVDSHAFVQEAAAVGKSGNLIRRYKELKDVEANPMNFEITYTLRTDSLESYLEALAERYDVAAEDSTLSRSGGQFVVTDHVVGRKVNVSKNVKQIRDEILEQWDKQDEIRLALVIDDVEPEYTREEMEQADSLLGSYTTEYPTANRGRAQNVENGCNLINGSIVYPGEVMSADEKMRPYTIANGYGVGGAYLNGEVIDSIGGGICQVSTTLYNAILYSELEVAARAAHSMTVNYVPLSRDAAIAGDYKDFKFKNNTELPVYVEGIARNGKITFNIYGQETRDPGRKVDFEYSVVETIEPGEDIVKEDPTKPTSYMEVTQGAFTGYTVHLYKVVYQDGVQVDRYRINTSYYKSSPRYVIQGTMEEPEEEIPEEETPEELPEETLPETPETPEETPEELPEEGVGEEEQIGEAEGSEDDLFGGE